MTVDLRAPAVPVRAGVLRRMFDYYERLGNLAARWFPALLIVAAILGHGKLMSVSSTSRSGFYRPPRSLPSPLETARSCCWATPG